MREIAADHTHENGGGDDGASLHGLEGAGEAERLAVLDHERVHEDVGEGEAERHEGDERGHPHVGVLAREPEEKTAHGRRSRREEEIALAVLAEEREEVREEAIDGLDQPGHVVMAKNVAI
jgi:hypothetical protein